MRPHYTHIRSIRASPGVSTQDLPSANRGSKPGSPQNVYRLEVGDDAAALDLTQPADVRRPDQVTQSPPDTPDHPQGEPDNDALLPPPPCCVSDDDQRGEPRSLNDDDSPGEPDACPDMREPAGGEIPGVPPTSQYGNTISRL